MMNKPVVNAGRIQSQHQIFSQHPQLLQQETSQDVVEIALDSYHPANPQRKKGMNRRKSTQIIKSNSQFIVSKKSTSNFLVHAPWLTLQ
jgi:hypothetical protein